MVYKDFKLIQENGMYSVSISDVVIYTTKNQGAAEMLIDHWRRASQPLTIGEVKAMQEGNFNYLNDYPNVKETIVSNEESK